MNAPDKLASFVVREGEASPIWESILPNLRADKGREGHGNGQREIARYTFHPRGTRGTAIGPTDFLPFTEDSE